MGRPRKDPLSKNATDTTTTTTTTDKSFGIQLNKNGIFYGRLEAEAPQDIAAVKDYLNRVRDSSKSPVEEDYKRYIEQVECGENELTVQSNVWPILAQHPNSTDRPGYIASYNFQWTEVESRLTFGLSDAKPDISESYRRNQYPLDVFDALGGALAPTQYKAAMPALCVEWKGPDGPMPSAEKQCAYDGALMVEAAFEAHKHMSKDSAEFFGKTHALTIALNGKDVQLYSNHVVKKASGLEYHQYPLRTHHPENSWTDFKETCNQLRNAQDWAQERAGRTKDDLHTYGRAKEVPPTILPEPVGTAEATSMK